MKTKIVGNTTVSLDFADCPSDGGKYQLLCENHGYLIQGDNKRTLWQFADDVAGWCEACQGNDDRFSNEKWSA